jgi:ABC-2 type transport system permease protein
MLRLIATIRKDLLILLRDKGGLAIMFLMPMAMIIIMALIQDAPFKDYQEIKIPLLLVNNDTGSLGKKIEQALEESKMVNITKLQLPTEEVKRKIKASEFEIGILVPATATENLNTNIHRFADSKLKAAGIAGTTVETEASPAVMEIQLFFAPGTKNAFKATILSSLKQSASKLETQALLDFFSKRLASHTSSAPQETLKEFINFKEIDTLERPQEALQLNSVQHNVPAWTIFGMFFIVISMAGSIIKEREDGSYTRLRTMPGSFAIVLIGKTNAYLLVCILQCILMLLVGVFLLPHLGLPVLHIGNNIPALVAMTLCTGLAATGYGILVGTVFKTYQQASTFGAVSIVILAALGGIWVPVFIMPELIRQLAEFSPLYWALNGYNKIFLADGSLQEVFPHMLKLLVFCILTMSISYFYNRKAFS